MMISESGAVVDLNEIAATLGMTEPLVVSDDNVIANASMEELLQDLSGICDDVEAGVIPVHDIEPALESLISVIGVIRDSGSISRADAQVLMQMSASMEGFQDTFVTMPLRSFTETPSMVNFEPSMENLMNRTLKAIVDAIRKAIAWVREKAREFINSFRTNLPKAKKVDQLTSQVGKKADIRKFEPEKFDSKQLDSNVESSELIDLMCNTKLVAQFKTEMTNLCSTYLTDPEGVITVDLLPYVERIAALFDISVRGGAPTERFKSLATAAAGVARKMSETKHLVPLAQAKPTFVLYVDCLKTMGDKTMTGITLGVSAVTTKSTADAMKLEKQLGVAGISPTQLEILKWRAFFCRDISFVMHALQDITRLISDSSVRMSTALIDTGLISK